MDKTRPMNVLSAKLQVGTVVPVQAAAVTSCKEYAVGSDDLHVFFARFDECKGPVLELSLVGDPILAVSRRRSPSCQRARGQGRIRGPAPLPYRLRASRRRCHV